MESSTLEKWCSMDTPACHLLCFPVPRSEFSGFDPLGYVRGWSDELGSDNNQDIDVDGS